MLFFAAIHAQDITVVDAVSGDPIPEVAIYNKEKSTAGVTNAHGIIDVSSFKNTETLYFSHVSYLPFQTKKSSLKKIAFRVFLHKKNEELDEVVLTVFKKKESSRRIAEQIAVLSLQEIQQISPQTSADLLATIPGIKVQKSQFGGGSPVLRGMESNRVLLVVDGVRMNNAIYRKGHLQNSITVSPNLLNRTEVIFGPSSVAYGSDALGGVIHYHTKTPRVSEKSLVTVQTFARFGSVNNEITTHAAVTARFKKWASFTSVSYSSFGDLTMGKNRTHGFKDWGKIPYFSSNSASFFTENQTQNTHPSLQPNTGYHQTDLLQKIVIPFSENTNLKINFQYTTSSNIPRFDKLTELSDGNLKFAEWHYGPQQRFLASTQLEINPEKKWMKSGVFTTAFQQIKESRIQRKFGSFDRSYRNESVDVFSVNGDFSVPLTPNKNSNLSYGFEWSNNWVSSRAVGKTLDVQGTTILGSSNAFTVQSRYPDGGSTYMNTALYTDYRQELTKKSTLNTGIRLTHTGLKAKWLDSTFITLPDPDISLENTAVTATIGYVYNATKNSKINAVLSSGFRSPNIDDVGKVGEKRGNITVPNIDLKPEYAYNAELGFQQDFLEKRVRINGSIYYTLLQNYIYREAFVLLGNSTVVYDGEAGMLVANQNKGNAYVTGFTTSYQATLHPNWKSTGFVTMTKGATYDTQEPMSSIPPLFGNVGLVYRYEKVEAGANLRFNARKKITEYNLTEGIDNQDETPVINALATEDLQRYYGSPSWYSLNLFSTYTFNPTWSVQGMVSNVLDTHYKEFASGVSAPGRNLSLIFRATF